MSAQSLQKHIEPIVEKFLSMGFETERSLDDDSGAFLLIVKIGEPTQEKLNAVSAVFEGLENSDECSIQCAMFIDGVVKAVFATANATVLIEAKRQEIAKELGYTDEQYATCIALSDDAPVDDIARSLAVGLVTAQRNALLAAESELLELNLLGIFTPVFIAKFGGRGPVDATAAITKAITIVMSWRRSVLATPSDVIQ